MNPDGTVEPQGNIENQVMSNATPTPLQQEQTNVVIEPQMQTLQADGGEERNKKNKKKIAIFVGLGVGIVAILVVLAVALPKIFANNPIAGEWDCHKFSWSGDATDEPVNKLILNTDGSFMYGSYGDLNNNHFAGRTYEYKEKKKDDASGFVSYTVEFGPTTEFVTNGIKQDTTGRQMSNMEIAVGVENGKKEAFVMLEDSYSMYLCTTE